MKRIVDLNLGQRDPVFVLHTSYWPENRVRNLMIAALLRDHDPLRRHRCPWCGEAGFMPHACLKEELAK